MATYRVMSWRDIPTQVKATDDSGATASVQLPGFFLKEVDRVAMAEGIIESDAYLEAWAWSEPQERDGDPQAVAAAVAVEVADAWRAANEATG